MYPHLNTKLCWINGLAGYVFLLQSFSPLCYEGTILSIHLGDSFFFLIESFWISKVLFYSMSHFQRCISEQKCCQRGVSSTTPFPVFEYTCHFPYFDFSEVEEALTKLMFPPVSLLSQNWENVLVKQLNISQSRLGLSWWLRRWRIHLAVQETGCSARDAGSIPEPGRSPGEGHGSLLQYSCLVDREARQTAGYGVLKESDTT